jgi:hypothetical protein
MDFPVRAAAFGELAMQERCTGIYRNTQQAVDLAVATACCRI